MSLDLTSVNAKLRQAEWHFHSVDSEVASRLNAKDYGVSKQFNADCTRHAWVFRAYKGTNFEDISLNFGDCVHNLRSALDHLVYAIAIHQSGQNPPLDANTLAFPLACNARQFHDAKRRIKSLSPSVRAVIETVQPYNRPHPEFPPLLGLLGEFDDIDKHRLLYVTIAAFAKASFGHHIPIGTKFSFFVNLKPLEDGAEIVAYVFDSPMPKDVTGDFDGDFLIAMPHAPGPGPIKPPGTEVRSLLIVLMEEVRAVVSIVAAAAS